LFCKVYSPAGTASNVKSCHRSTNSCFRYCKNFGIVSCRSNMSNTTDAITLNTSDITTDVVLTNSGPLAVKEYLGQI
jgi:hypothetical protein